jgi:hypothetical protein
MYERKNLNWLVPKKGNLSLWQGDNYILALVPHEKYEKMFYLAWPDGTKSDDFYNLEHAKENAVRVTLSDLNRIYENGT